VRVRLNAGLDLIPQHSTVSFLARIMASKIAVSVAERSTATQEMSRNIAQAATGTQDVSSSIGTVARAAAETSAASAEVLTSASDLSAQAERLSTEVDKFLTNIKAA